MEELIEEVTDQERLARMNTCRLWLKVHHRIDVMTVDTSKVMEEYVRGERLRRSRWKWRHSRVDWCHNFSTTTRWGRFLSADKRAEHEQIAPLCPNETFHCGITATAVYSGPSSGTIAMVWTLVKSTDLLLHLWVQWTKEREGASSFQLIWICDVHGRIHFW